MVGFASVSVGAVHRYVSGSPSWSFASAETVEALQTSIVHGLHCAFTVGGRFGYVDDGETANTQVCVFDYGDCQLIFEVRGLKTNDLMGAKVGNIFYGTEGYMVVPNYSKATAYTLGGEKIREFSGSEDHFGNFIKAVRSRNVLQLLAAGGNVYYLAKFAGIFGLDMQDIGAQQTGMSKADFQARLQRASAQG